MAGLELNYIDKNGLKLTEIYLPLSPMLGLNEYATITPAPIF